MFASRRREPSWEVIGRKEVVPVPTYFQDPDVQIMSVFSEDISQTFVFHNFTRLRPKFLSKSSSFSFATRSRSSSLDSNGSSSSSESEDGGFSPRQLRNALLLARKQFLESSKMKNLDANALFYEGWTMTKLQKGTHHRLQIRYCGRPARATFASPDALPPFLDILDDWR